MYMYKYIHVYYLRGKRLTLVSCVRVTVGCGEVWSAMAGFGLLWALHGTGVWSDLVFCGLFRFVLVVPLSSPLA